ncbi:MAG: hypothetical protein HQL32_04855 [Planctomycetes bacterium]|nr:hypothetical protein [Planctomycetota bacterium]
MRKKDLKAPLNSSRANRFYWAAGFFIFWNPILLLLYPLYCRISSMPSKRLISFLPHGALAMQILGLLILWTSQQSHPIAPFTLSLSGNGMIQSPEEQQPLSNLSLSLSCHSDQINSSHSSTTSRNSLALFSCENVLIQIEDDHHITQQVGKHLAQLLIGKAGIETVFFEPSGDFPSKRVDIIIKLSSDFNSIRIPSGAYQLSGILYAKMNSQLGSKMVQISSKQEVNYSGSLTGMDIGVAPYEKSAISLAKQVASTTIETFTKTAEDTPYKGRIPHEFYPSMASLSLPEEIPTQYIYSSEQQAFLTHGQIHVQYPPLPVLASGGDGESSLERIPDVQALFKNLREKGWKKLGSSWSSGLWNGNFEKGYDNINYTLEYIQQPEKQEASLSLRYTKGLSNKEIEDLITPFMGDHRYNLLLLSLSKHLPDHLINTLIRGIHYTQISAKSFHSIISQNHHRLGEESKAYYSQAMRAFYFTSRDRPSDNDLKKLAKDMQAEPINTSQHPSIEELQSWGISSLPPHTNEREIPKEFKDFIYQSPKAWDIIECPLEQRVLKHSPDGSKLFWVESHRATDKEGDDCVFIKTGTTNIWRNGSSWSTSTYKLEDKALGFKSCGTMNGRGCVIQFPENIEQQNLKILLFTNQ